VVRLYREVLRGVVNRPSRRPGLGVAPEVETAPDLELPDPLSLAEAAGL
jgi:hypothetical protein